MTSYISIANSEIDPNSGITAELMTKLRDNPIAISEGNSSAPNILLGIAAKTVAGGVGTYVFAKYSSDVAFGTTVAGSSLNPASAIYAITLPSAAEVSAGLATSSALTGTWMCMGNFVSSSTWSSGGGSVAGATLWVRIV